MEQWKDVVGYEGLYQISDKGRVKGLKRNKVLAPRYKNKTPYMLASLHKDGKQTNKQVHRLVLMAFNPIEDSHLYHVDHIDHNPSNNELTNLRWILPEVNQSKEFKKRGTVSQLLLEIEQLKEEIDRLKGCGCHG